MRHKDPYARGPHLSTQEALLHARVETLYASHKEGLSTPKLCFQAEKLMDGITLENVHRVTALTHGTTGHNLMSFSADVLGQGWRKEGDQEDPKESLFCRLVGMGADANKRDVAGRLPSLEALRQDPTELNPCDLRFALDPAGGNMDVFALDDHGHCGLSVSSFSAQTGMVLRTHVEDRWKEASKSTRLAWLNDCRSCIHEDHLPWFTLLYQSHLEEILPQATRSPRPRM